MSIADNETRIQNISTGQTTFAYPFECFEDTDLVVYKNSVLQTLTTHYTVTGVGDTNGGNVVFGTATTTGDIIIIYRSVAYERSVDYQSSGDFRAVNVNEDFDRIWAKLQEHRTSIDRTLYIPVNDTTPSSELALPSVANRSSKVLGFDSTGGITTYTPHSSINTSIEIEVSSVEALRALDTDASTLLLLGHTEIGDGAEGIFYKDGTDDSSDDNGGTIIHDSNSNRWKRLYSREFHVAWFGPVADGVIGTDICSGTDNASIFQSAIDAAPDGSTIILPKGRYFFDRDNAAYGYGSTYVINKTGLGSYDAPDTAMVIIDERKHLHIIGDDTEIVWNRGFPFFCVFSENITFENIRFQMYSDVYETNETFDDGVDLGQPSSIHIGYSVGCTVKKCRVIGAYRGIWLIRNADCLIEENIVYGCQYMCIASYGDLFPSGVTIDGSSFDITTFFEYPHTYPASGIKILNNRVRCYGYLGIYSDGRCIISHNNVDEFMNLTASGSTGVVGITARSGAGSTITDNRIRNSLTNELLGIGTSVFIDGINLSVEDVNDGSSYNDLIANNSIEGICVGITLIETKGTIVEGNVIDQYTVAAIGISGYEIVGIIRSQINNTLIQNNYIGRVATGTVRGDGTNHNRGGITTYLTGTVNDGKYFGLLAIKDNLFNMQTNLIVDAGVKAIFEVRGIWGQMKDDSELIIEGNIMGANNGKIKMYTSLANYGARKIQGMPVVYTTSSTIPENRHNDIYVTWDGASGGTLTLPSLLFPGQRIHILNVAENALVIVANHVVSTICGDLGYDLTLDNSADATARSSVTLVATDGSHSDDRHNVEILTSSVIGGATIALT